MNGTVTGTLLASVLVAALDHRGPRPDVLGYLLGYRLSAFPLNLPYTLSE